MGKNFDKASEKLAPFVATGQPFVVAVPIRDAWSDDGTSSTLSQSLSRYLDEQGLDPRDDLLRRIGTGWLGLTDDQILIAKEKLFGALKPKHLLVDALRDACRVEWYDTDRDSKVGGSRDLVLSLDDGRFAIVVIWLPTFGKESYTEELREAANAVIEWFGQRATQIAEPS